MDAYILIPEYATCYRSEERTDKMCPEAESRKSERNRSPDDVFLFFGEYSDEENGYPTPEERKELSREYFCTGKHSAGKFYVRAEGDESDGVTVSEDGDGECEAAEKEVCCKRNCLAAFAKEEIAERRRAFAEMDKHEQDICILSQLAVMKTDGRKKDDPVGPVRERIRFSYRFDNSRPLCRKAFMSAHGIRTDRLKRLQRLSACGVLLPPPHGNAGRIPGHAVHSDDAEYFRNFMTGYAEAHGLPDPGRLRKDTREILLPTSDSYTSVWKKYRNGRKPLSESGDRPPRVVGYNTFRRLWKQMTPHIRFMSPRTDLCDRCEELKNGIRHAPSHQQTARLVGEYDSHRADADAARQAYRSQITEARESRRTFSEDERLGILSSLSGVTSAIRQKPCSRDMTMHYSFDFAQQVHYPFSCQQRGREFFKTARKCQIFGVCAEALPRQVFFLTDESEFSGRGSRTVISFLDAFFSLHGLGEKTVRLHADNCTGQNKNNYVMWYLLWRVMNGLHERISLSFMMPGHTKFEPDGYFGLFKLRYRRSTVDCLQDLADCVAGASAKGCTVPQVYGRHYGLSHNAFEFREWNSFLGQHFNPVENILNYNHFDFDCEKPGVVSLRVRQADSPRSVSLLRKRFFRFPLPVRYPEPLFPKGLSYDRQEYLYREIRPFVRDHSKRDITCPKPV